MTKHTFDTNIIINLQNYYPRDLFGYIWDALEAGAASHEYCICASVHQELNRSGDPLFTWAKNLPGLICQITSHEMQLAAKISQEHPGWVSEQKNAADPFLVAHAIHEGSVIVTNERRAGPGVTDAKQKIPNVAGENGVTTISFLDFLRSAPWSRR